MVKEEYEEPEFDIPEGQLDFTMPTALKTAVMTFPAGTGLGKDNVSPRALARLFARALEALGTTKIVRLGRLGNLCEVLNLVLIVLLPKTDGVLRHIGHFLATIRVWMRSRILVAKAWETLTAVPTIFGGPGMGAKAAA